MRQRSALPPLYLIAFVGGMATLGLETAAARIIGTGFGTSNVVWTSVIAVVLVTMALGNWLAGNVAHTRHAARWLFGSLALAGLWCAAIPMLARTLSSATAAAWATAHVGLVPAAAGVALLLFGFPVLAFGGVLPLTVSLAATAPPDTGRVTGRLSAITTLGAVLGTFIPTYVLIPTIGTAATCLALSLLVTTLALWGLARVHHWTTCLATVGSLAIVIAYEVTGSHPSPVPPGTTLLHEAESTYNAIRVAEAHDVHGLPPGTRLLWLNDGDGIQSIHEPTPTTAGYWALFAAAPFFNPRPYDPHELRRVCVVGLAGGTVAKVLTRVFGAHVRIDGYEIDEAILQVAGRWFDLTDVNITRIVADGRVGLATTATKYDLIVLDVFRGSQIPWHMGTHEFFELARRRLSRRGVLAMNLTRRPWAWMTHEDRAVVEALTTTLSAVFPTVHTIDVPNSFNTILVATPSPTSMADLVENADGVRSSADPLLVRILDDVMGGMRPSVRSRQLQTDDRTTLEGLVNAAAGAALSRR